MKKCQEYANQGYWYVIDMDLEKFFDTVNQSMLIEILSRTIEDNRVLSLICKFPNVGIMDRGMFINSKIGCGNLYITVNYDDQGICEVFTNLGRAGGCPSQSEATSRLISLALRSGIDVETIIEQLKGIRCHSTLRQKGLKVLSCPDAIGRVLEKVAMLKLDDTLDGANDIDIGNHNMIDRHSCLGNCSLCSLKDVCQNPQRRNGGIYLGVNTDREKNLNGICPECGTIMEHEGGCVVCRACGYSKCN